ncbi:MAG: hypothetical protein Q8O26_05015 [Phreatobacter sp.]|uniref:hypothetical protein n=1 Tax=Phreatobacter sp. TaxID=1966341 RepID=UPI0027355BEC|nr:hypothetical protein [Phreatobacter sp.]MDP2801227.1 hypothetical protein [Phreatobacter sp.]
MDRRFFLLSLAGGAFAATVVGSAAAEAAPAATPTLDGVRGALGAGETLEMQGGGRGGGRGGGGRGGGFRGGGGGFRGGFRGGGFRPGRGYRRGWGGPGWGGPPRRCFVNRWGEWVCRRPAW